jgi:tetratricopeptide (TPR) repeat protein
MLLVLDNARDVEQVRPLLPASPACLVMVTSRSPLAGLAAVEGAHLVSLGMLSQADARTLLARRLGAERLGTGPMADELIELCARLPLALSVASARAAEHPGFPLRAVVADLRDERRRLDALEVGDRASGVRVVFSWSYENLSEPAARVFRLLGLHPGPDLTAVAAASLAGVPLVQASHALGELVRAGLVSEHSPGRFGCHDLLRSYAGERTEAEDTEAERQAALGRVAEYYLRASAVLSRLFDPASDHLRFLPPAEPGTLVRGFTDHAQAVAWLEAERRVLLAVVAAAARAGLDAHAWQIPCLLERVFFQRGWWHDLETAERVALEAATRTGDLAGQAYTLRGRGRVRAARGSFAEGHADLTQALRLFEELRDDAAGGQVHVYMAFGYGRQGRYRDALRHVERARELFQATGHQAGQAAALNNIGWYHAQLGNHEQALTRSRQALRAFRELGDRRGEAIAMDSLGCAHRHLGDHAQALVFSQRALAVVRELGDRYSQADILANIGDAHHVAGNDRAARVAWAEALVTLEERNPAQADQLRARLDSPG